MNQIKKKQHYVPQCYLRRFADINKKLFVLDKVNNKVTPSNVGDIAQSRYFNDFPDSFLPEDLKDKSESQFIENELGKIETRFGIFLEQIISTLENINQYPTIDFVKILDSKDKKKLSKFLALQLVRTNSYRKNTVEYLLKEMCDLSERGKSQLEGLDQDKIVGFDIPDQINSLEISDPDELIRENIKDDSKYHHLLYINKHIEQRENSETSLMLLNHEWLFGINHTSTPLLTSDSPIVIKANKDGDMGLASPSVQILYPLSPKYLLIMSETSSLKNPQRYDCMSVFLSDQNIQSHNKLQLQQCNRQVYCEDKNVLDFWLAKLQKVDK